MHELIAAIDLGSNSFRLQVGKIVNDQIYPLDGIKEPVRLAAGLTTDKQLDKAARERALAALGRFNERQIGAPYDTGRGRSTITRRMTSTALYALTSSEKR